MHTSAAYIWKLFPNFGVCVWILTHQHKNHFRVWGAHWGSCVCNILCIYNYRSYLTLLWWTLFHIISIYDFIWWGLPGTPISSRIIATYSFSMGNGPWDSDRYPTSQIHPSYSLLCVASHSGAGINRFNISSFSASQGLHMGRTDIGTAGCSTRPKKERRPSAKVCSPSCLKEQPWLGRNLGRRSRTMLGFLSEWGPCIEKAQINLWNLHINTVESKHKLSSSNILEKIIQTNPQPKPNPATQVCTGFAVDRHASAAR